MSDVPGQMRPYGNVNNMIHARRVVCGDRVVKDTYGPDGAPAYPCVALVYGSRTWTDPTPIQAYIDDLPEGTLVVHGGARGADTLAGLAAQRRGLAVHVYRADWERQGRRAGPLRNQQMLDSERVTEACGFRMPGPSRGTDDMTERLYRAGIGYEVMTP